LTAKVNFEKMMVNCREKGEGTQNDGMNEIEEREKE
jgi:hypothetical protein